MRTRSALRVLTLSLSCAPLFLGGCGDDSTGSGGSGGTGETSASSTSDASSTTTTAATSTSASSGGSDGGGSGDGGAGDGGAAEGGGTSEGGGAEGGATGAGGEDVVLTPIWEDVAYKEDGGRVDLDSFIGVTLQVRETGTEDVIVDLPNQILPAGVIVHAYAIGRVADDTLDAFLTADDTSFEEPDPGDGNLRLGHFAPDVEPYDVYMIDEDFNSYGPLLDSTLFDYPNVSGYGSFPPGTYEATVVPGGGSPLGDVIGVFSGLEIVEGKSQTFALLGLAEDDSLEMVVYTDDVHEPEAGRGAVTFVNAVSDAPNVDVIAFLPEE